MALNPDFEMEQAKRLKTGMILLIIGFLLSIVGGPVGLIVTIVAVWRIATSVTDTNAKKWKLLMILGLAAALIAAVWSGFYLDILFKQFGTATPSVMDFIDPGKG